VVAEVHLILLGRLLAVVVVQAVAEVVALPVRVVQELQAQFKATQEELAQMMAVLPMQQVVVVVVQEQTAATLLAQAVLVLEALVVMV
jgi:hypothetical protein